MDQHDRDRGAQGRRRQRAQAPATQLLVHAALRQQREAEAGLDHPLLRREAVDVDDLGIAEPAGGQPVLEQRGVRLGPGRRARRERDPPLAGQRRRSQAPRAGQPVAR